MKKILIVNNNMHIGGVQKALVNLLWNIRGQYEITLLLFCKTGECLKDLPPDVKVITVRSAYRYLGMTGSDTRGIFQKLGRSFYAALTRIFGRKYAIWLMALGQKKLKGYDVAISYLHNAGRKMFYGGCNDFVLRHVPGAKKVSFLHCDYVGCGANTSENRKLYEKFHKIAACSAGCGETFLRANPHLKDKLQVVCNCHNFQDIRKKAEEAPQILPTDTVNLLTVARLGKEKGVERALRVIAGLGNLKKNIHYYIIGDGIQMPVLRQLLEQNDLSGCVSLCGAMENPYGYMKAADLLVIPSYNEAAPLVIGEAAFLGTPILSMETSSAREMIEKTGFGWVCANTEEAMQKALKQLLADPAVLDEKKALLANRSIGNETAVSQFAKLIAD